MIPGGLGNLSHRYRPQLNCFAFAFAKRERYGFPFKQRAELWVLDGRGLNLLPSKDFVAAGDNIL